MQTLEEYIQHWAQIEPERLAVVCADTTVTYAQLWQGIQLRADELRGQGIEAGCVHLFRASQTVDFLFTYFALHLIGAAAAPLERDVPDAVFNDFQQKIQAAGRVPEGVADVLFTTGTTGKSKGVMISHRTIIADAENLIDAQGFSHDLLFVISGPLNHIGSLSKVYPVVILGAAIYITEGMKDVNALLDALEYSERKTATFLVPASLRILLQLSRKRLEALANKIDFIETGAAPMMQSDMEDLCQVLPHTRLYNTYASTETGIISTYNYNDGQCLAGCLGRPMKHSRIIIGEGGQIQCQGPTLMTGYLGDEALTATVLHDDTLFTADCGRIDENGCLRLQGRNDDTINVGGYKVNPVEVEDATASFPGVADCICIAMQHQVLGPVLKLLVKMKPGHELQKRPLAQHLLTRLDRYKVPQFYESVENVERTYNGKLNRKFYR